MRISSHILKWSICWSNNCWWCSDITKPSKLALAIQGVSRGPLKIEDQWKYKFLSKLIHGHYYYCSRNIFFNIILNSRIIWYFAATETFQEMPYNILKIWREFTHSKDKFGYGNHPRYIKEELLPLAKKPHGNLVICISIKKQLCGRLCCP